MAARAPSTGFIIEFSNEWRAWYITPDGTQQPIRFNGGRQDSQFPDAPMGMMQLAHAIIADVLRDPCGFDDYYRSGPGQERLRRFGEDVIRPIKNNSPQQRQVISAKDVATWLSDHPAV